MYMCQGKEPCPNSHCPSVCAPLVVFTKSWVMWMIFTLISDYTRSTPNAYVCFIQSYCPVTALV